ncbi:UDP-N-acetylglucosamine 1-carboxyvinyltransferase [Sulfurospirillum sp. T05]|uniref:UDP-N-acetylglucosamine 1-carboxyvinyltransferase n=1 Tax=Sulfurospirillum tamanense TaxID=2813362 RepID=A0ABS2WSE4_9BACT|nr:UDP-N-acetylglucosamine 1-carboxyvinyltransferase [Sulfurospirillum tamanensis]MBN2964591.1 UDP-N-acetylglucosamine 1-carboxyvinyltransferase [Sulfurospirillum tamanensis]
MYYLQIEGRYPLHGEVAISGAKNAALPLLASTLLCATPVRLNNVPKVADVQTFMKLLEHLGASCTFENNQATIDASTVNSTCANYDIVRKMRASILTLGPLLARFGQCEVSLPGGCAIGQRPIDLHLKALEQMGAVIEIKQGYVVATALEGLKGSTIVFDKVTVTGSENIIMAAALAHGNSTLVNVAQEPEVVQLCEVLMAAGVPIEGVGSNELHIQGSGQTLLSFPEICVIPDRIEAGTYLCAGAITNSPITLTHVRPDHLRALTRKLLKMGFGINETKNSVSLVPAKTIASVDIETTEYPGFPTDMQAQFMALVTQAKGTSVIDERLFENRFMHVSELTRMGAQIRLKGHSATVQGECSLTGADVMATDLRASSALVLAALVAQGTTRIHRIYHLDRGYEDLEGKLAKLGAKITRLSE